MSLALTGFALGLWCAALSGAGEGQGLASGAIVLFYGLLGAVLGFALALLLLRKLALAALRRLSLVVLPLGVVIGSLIVAALLRSRADMQAHLAEAYTRLPLFQLHLQPGPAIGGQWVEHFSADWDEKVFRVTTGSVECSFPLNGAQAVQVLTALRNAEGVLYSNPAACEDYTDAAQYHLRFNIHEAKPPNTAVNLPLSTACLRAYPALGEPYDAARALLESVEITADCRQPD